MMVAMATDIRVILIKLADRLHNMRTLGALPKQKQIEKAKETLEIYAPLAHRLGIHAIKWELEDLAFATLHPRKYQEIKGLVSQQRDERERYVARAGGYLAKELEALGIDAEISGRAKHFYSIYSKMTRKGREFNEIYDLTAMRVIVDSVKDCYGAVGVIHSLWKPLPGRFKDMVAMPKFNMYQALHTTVIGPEGRPLEIQIRTRDMHETAEYGVAAHWRYKEGAKGSQAGIDPTDAKLKWLKSLLDWQGDEDDPREFTDHLRDELIEDEVFVFTPKGEVKSLAAGATPLDFAYEIHTDVGHRCVGAKVNGKIVPLHYELQSGDIVEILTVQARARPVARLAGARQDDPRAQQDPRVVQGRVARGLRAHRPRAAAGAPQQGRAAGAEDHRLAAAGGRDPRDGLPQGRRLLHRARRRQDLAQGRRQQGAAAPQAGRGAPRPSPRPPTTCCKPHAPAREPEALVVEVRHPRRGRRRRPAAPGQVLPPGVGRPDRRLRLARPRHHDPPRGLPERGGAAQGPGALRARCPGTATTRPRSRSRCRSTRGTATACSRTSRARSPRAAINIVEARCIVAAPDGQEPLRRSRWATRRRSKTAINRLRSIDVGVRRLPRHAGAGG